MRSNAYDAFDRIRWPGTRTTRLPLPKRRVNRITQSKRPAASGRLRPEVAGCATETENESGGECKEQEAVSPLIN